MSNALPLVTNAMPLVANAVAIYLERILRVWVVALAADFTGTVFFVTESNLFFISKLSQTFSKNAPERSIS